MSARTLFLIATVAALAACTNPQANDPLYAQCRHEVQMSDPTYRFADPWMIKQCMETKRASFTR